MTLEEPVGPVRDPTRAAPAIRVISDLADLDAASRLLSMVWDRTPDSRPVTVSLLRALSMTGNYVSAAFLDGRIVGAAVGFLASDGHGLHSHITGVDARARAQHVGFLLKSHQRTWALDRQIRRITWTFDPLVRRNAYFNLVKLGARATAYERNLYGKMRDGLNQGEESDRLLVEWDLLSDDAVAASLGHPREWPTVDGIPSLISCSPLGVPIPARWAGTPALVPVPEDIEAVRAANPGLAHDWREAVRGLLDGALHEGAQIVGFHRSGGYVLAPAHVRQTVMTERKAPL